MKEFCTCTKKPSEVNSNMIVDVQGKKDSVLIVFQDKKIAVDLTTYIDGFYYPGKTLSNQEFKELLHCEKLKNARNYIKNILARGRYTECQLKQKLKTRYSLTAKEIQIILKPYIESCVINDVQYALDFIQNRREKGYGPRFIQAELKKRKIADSIIESSKIQSILKAENPDINNLIQRLNKSKQNLTLEKRKEYIASSLFRKGFSFEKAQEKIEQFFFSRDEQTIKEEQEHRRVLLLKEAKKCYNLTRQKTLNAYKKKDVFIRTLLHKGFRYEEIQHLLESEDYTFHD